ncbi:DivIVA domain-containing protein [Bifidobacterium xylocopae]|uniref:DivIVA domain-containing protein n=1 Tax=Bifidobacterium xylocopae TaxID=2493119 RepID=A0A366KEB2_9BIFI|nr:DivIVA domain-containing protein [Bifidobacterium xylocopae]RBQ00041.1 hypothetical protein CRD59_00840 [Bifidobacterium xylocopae]
MRVLTPRDINRADFDLRWMGRGYDTDQVDAVLDECAYTVRLVGMECLRLTAQTRRQAACLSSHRVASAGSRVSYRGRTVGPRGRRVSPWASR